MAYEDLNKEVRQIRDHFEQQSYLLEQTMTEELRERSEKEQRLNDKIESMAGEIEQLKMKKAEADKGLQDRIDQLR